MTLSKFWQVALGINIVGWLFYALILWYTSTITAHISSPAFGIEEASYWRLAAIHHATLGILSALIAIVFILAAIYLKGKE